MESQIKTWALVATSALAASCASTGTTESVGVRSPRPVAIAVQQVGSGETKRYVYCAVDECSALTPKTPPVQRTGQSSPPTAAALQKSTTALLTSDLDIPFTTSSSHIGLVDRDRIAVAAARTKSDLVLISARSDFNGPAAQQQRLAAARAQALRSVIASNVSPTARIVEALEIAEPNTGATPTQASQRQGTVRFVVRPSTNL